MWATTPKGLVNVPIKEDLMSIPFEGISRLLPFPTQIVAGFNHNHIMSTYAHDIKTETRTISEGDTLCGRKSSKFFLEANTNCPGCSAIGENLAQVLRVNYSPRPLELGPSTLTRNRHTIENDRKTALIKRINRKMRPENWNLKVGRDGKLHIVLVSTGADVFDRPWPTPLDHLAAIWGVQNATVCVDVTK